jgi:hypothetical protein
MLCYVDVKTHDEKLQNIMLIVLYIQTDIKLYWQCSAVLQQNMQTAQLAENYFFSISCNTVIPELQEACQPCSFGRFKSPIPK